MKKLQHRCLVWFLIHPWLRNQRHYSIFLIWFKPLIFRWIQGRREGTSSATFEVLIINCETDFINLFVFNYLASNINLFIFNCLMLNINLFIFNCLTSNFCFPKNIFRKQKRTVVYGRESVVSDFKLTRETNKFLRYCLLCTSILKCGFPAKGI